MEQSCLDKIAIVGAGPAGIYCALNILKTLPSASISIFDIGQALRTILPTGGGRCNLTNSIMDVKEFASNYPRGEKFLYSLFSRHFNLDSINFFKKIGIQTYVQEDGRIFPKSNSAKDVKDKLLNELKKFKNAKLINKHILSIEELNAFDFVIIATGSKNCAKLLESTKHPLIPFKKALCGLNVENFKYPKGVSVKSLDGDFVFTQNGISGPLAFKISSLKACDEFPYELSIKLFNPEELFILVKQNPKKTIGNLVSKFIPKSLANVIVDDFDKKAGEISKQKIIDYSFLKLKIISKSSQGEIVNAGGVDLKYIDKNCKSKLKNNLWFCGEVLNIDGFCGGFNLQNCWSSAYVVACDVVSLIANRK